MLLQLLIVAEVSVVMHLPELNVSLQLIERLLGGGCPRSTPEVHLIERVVHHLIRARGHVLGGWGVPATVGGGISVVLERVLIRGSLDGLSRRYGTLELLSIEHELLLFSRDVGVTVPC